MSWGIDITNCLDSIVSVSSQSITPLSTSISPAVSIPTLSETTYLGSPHLVALIDSNLCHVCNLTATLNPDDNTTFCSCDSLTLSAEMGMTNYYWNNGQTMQSINVNTTGNYSVVIIDSNNCSATSFPVDVFVRYCAFDISLKVFIEGFYQTNSTMNASIDPINYPSLCDTVVLQLASPNYPYNILYSDTARIDINGNGIFHFNTTPDLDNYYLVVRHRNSIETWSASPIEINSFLSDYKFTTSINQAFDNNLKNLNDGNYGIYSGDLNQDGVVDGSDFLQLDPSIQNGDGGYLIGDLNGDGSVDGSDLLVMDPNIQFGVGIARP